MQRRRYTLHMSRPRVWSQDVIWSGVGVQVRVLGASRVLGSRSGSGVGSGVGVQGRERCRGLRLKECTSPRHIVLTLYSFPMLTATVPIPLHVVGTVACPWTATRVANAVTREPDVPLVLTRVVSPGGVVARYAIPAHTTVQVAVWVPPMGTLYVCLEDRRDSAALTLCLAAFPVPDPVAALEVVPPVWMWPVLTLPLREPAGDNVGVVPQPTGTLLALWPSPVDGVHLCVWLRRRTDNVAALAAAHVTSAHVSVYGYIPLPSAAHTVTVKGTLTSSIWSPPLLGVYNPAPTGVPRLVAGTLVASWELPPAMWTPLVSNLIARLRQPGLVESILEWAQVDRPVGLPANPTMEEALESAVTTARGATLLGRHPTALAGALTTVTAHLMTTFVAVDNVKSLKHDILTIRNKLALAVPDECLPVVATPWWTAQAVLYDGHGTYVDHVPWSALLHAALPPWDASSASSIPPSGVVARWVTVAKWVQYGRTAVPDDVHGALRDVVAQAISATQSNPGPKAAAAWTLLVAVLLESPKVPVDVHAAVCAALQIEAPVTTAVLTHAPQALSSMLSVTSLDVLGPDRHARGPGALERWRPWWASVVARLQNVPPAPSAASTRAAWLRQLYPPLPLTILTARDLGEALWHVAQLTRTLNVNDWVTQWLPGVAHGVHSAAWALRHQPGVRHLDTVLEAPLTDATLALGWALACPATPVPVVAGCWGHLLGLHGVFDMVCGPRLNLEVLLVSVAAAVQGLPYAPQATGTGRPLVEWVPLGNPQGEQLLENMNTMPLMAWWSTHLGVPGVTTAWLPASWTHDVPSVCAGVWAGALMCISQWVDGAVCTVLPEVDVPVCVNHLATWLHGLHRTLWRHPQVSGVAWRDLVHASTTTLTALLDSVYIPELAHGQSAEDAYRCFRAGYLQHDLWWLAMSMTVDHRRHKAKVMCLRLLQTWWTMEVGYNWTVPDVDCCVAMVAQLMPRYGWVDVLEHIDQWTAGFQYHQSASLVYFAVAFLRVVVSTPDVDVCVAPTFLTHLLDRMQLWAAQHPALLADDVHADLQRWV